MGVRGAARAAVLASLPTLTSCVGDASRSNVLSFLEAVQRPFDLHDRTWLGIWAGARVRARAVENDEDEESTLIEGDVSQPE